MAKELPYFQFEPAEYLTKDVSFCSLSAQGLFINICAYYWQRGCVLTKEQVLRRLDYEDELNELIEEGIIDIDEGKIEIKFLDEQWEKATEKSRINKQNGSKGGRPKNPNKTELKPNANRNESESKGNRREEIRIEDKKEKNNIEERKTEFINSLHPFLNIYSNQLLKDFAEYWTEHGEKDRKMRFEKETSFSINRRLKTWKKNEFKFGNSKINIGEYDENRYKGVSFDGY